MVGGLGTILLLEVIFYGPREVSRATGLVNGRTYEVCGEIADQLLVVAEDGRCVLLDLRYAKKAPVAG